MEHLILGLGILSKHRLRINWGQDGKIYLHHGNREIVHSISEVFPGTQLRTVSKVMISPRSSVVIPTKQTNIQPQTSEILQVKENPYLTDENPGLVIPSVLHIRHEIDPVYIPLSVVNIFDEPIELKKSEIVATLEQTSISQTDIHQINARITDEPVSDALPFTPPMSKLISSPADVLKHQKVNLKDAIISDYIQKKFEKPCEDFVDIFSTGQSDTKLIEMDIDTGNSSPVYQKLYTLPLKHNQWVKEELEALEKAGIIS